jgi:hypothetical protein
MTAKWEGKLTRSCEAEMAGLNSDCSQNYWVGSNVRCVTAVQSYRKRSALFSCTNYKKVETSGLPPRSKIQIVEAACEVLLLPTTEGSSSGLPE